MLHTCMNSLVTLQLIRPREAFATETPHALKWLLSNVPTEMRSQMGSLAVRLSTSRNMANVRFLFPIQTPNANKTSSQKGADQTENKATSQIATIK